MTLYCITYNVLVRSKVGPLALFLTIASFQTYLSVGPPFYVILNSTNLKFDYTDPKLQVGGNDNECKARDIVRALWRFLAGGWR